MRTDPLSDILRITKAEMVATGGFSAGGPWAIRFPAPRSINFFAVVRGHCWVTIEGEPEPFRFDRGDVGLLTAERAFVLATDLTLEPLDAMSVFSGTGRSEAVFGDGNDFEHVGGHVRVDPRSGRLLADVLPAWIHISAASQEATTLRWLLDQLVEERSVIHPGGQLAAEQLAQLLFIQVLRARMRAPTMMPAGWLRALCDPRVAPAMRLMHGDPARSWHLDELAKACAMSRTTFATRFRAVVGAAPLAYLGQWRMHLAERNLREDTKPIAIIGQSLGYTSESAFSNAFKRIMGQSPRAHRLQSAGAFQSSDTIEVGLP